MHVYMAVECNEYELPVAIADTAGELALMVGIDKQRMFEEMSRAKRMGRWCRFIKVPLDEDFDLPEYAVRKPKADDKRRHRVLMVGEYSKEFKSVKEAAKFTGKNISTIRRWLNDGQGNGCKWYRI